MSFPSDPHSKAYVCRHVFDLAHPVRLVNRADGDWCFLCGGYHKDDASEYRVIGIGHVLESDRTLLELHDLPSEWEAERQVKGSDWVRTPPGSTRN
jgi:hypothetical protein